MDISAFPLDDPYLLRPDDLSLRFRLDVDRIEVAAAGDLDITTVPVLAAALDAVIQEGFVQVVLDLSKLALLGAAGISEIVAVSTRVAAAGGMLTLASPNRRVQQVLDIAGVALPTVVARPPTATTAEMAADVVQMRAILDRNALADTALTTLTGVVSRAVQGADGASVSLQRDGRIATVAASNDTVVRMDRHQYDTAQGPCILAAAEGSRVVVPSLADEQRWPDFIPRARSEGIASILSTPVVWADRPTGALNIYSAHEGAFGAREEEIAQGFADLASAFLHDDHPTDPDDAAGHRISDALRSRDVISRAQGVLMHRHGYDAAQAAAMMHRDARATTTTVLDLASELLAFTAAAEDGHDQRDV